MTESPLVPAGERAGCAPTRGPASPIPAEAADGLLRIEVDTAHGRLALDYDAARMPPGKAEALARRVAAAIAEAPAAACVLHVGQRGGRSCESCAHRLEARLLAAPGVRRANASFRSGVLRVDYDAAVTSPDRIARTVQAFGIPALGEAPAPDTAPADGRAAEPRPLTRRIRAWLARERVEAVFVALTLGGLLLGLLADWQAWGSAVVWTGYGAAYVFGGWFGLRAGLESLRHAAVDIDLLMILAAGGALAIGAPFEGAMLLFLFSLSNVLQHYAIGRSRSAIQALMKLRPETARLRRGADWVETPIGEAAVGDVFLVTPGDRLPLDGVVVQGQSAVDQASLTGESVPVEKGAGDAVFGGTMNGGGALEVRVTKPAGESAIARMIALVEEAQSEKAETQRLIDRFEQPYALGVIGMTALAIALPTLAFGEAFGPAFYRAMTLMVAASPCALVISTPAAVLSAIAAAARSGVLFKGGVYVEEAATVRAVAFDKTGTLTEGRSRLTALEVLAEDVTEGELLALAAAVQTRSEHHLARATVEAARARGLEVPEASGFQAVVGQGVRAAVGGRTIHIGNPRYFSEWQGEGLAAALEGLRRLQAEGQTAVVVAHEEAGERRVLGLAAFADALRPGAAEVVAALKRLGVEHVAMLTGDNADVGHAIGAEAGVDAVYADLLPERKVALVRELEARYGKVAMVGDGVNDAPALAAATIGVAMGAAGTDVALETADVVLMADDLSKIPYTLGLSRRTRRTLIANLSFALGMIALMVGAILTIGLPLPLAVVGHEGSTVVVSLNGLRLLAAREG